MHGLFQPNKGNWLLGALLHWRPHSKKPFWHQASCNRVDFKTNIASYDLRFKSKSKSKYKYKSKYRQLWPPIQKLYDRHVAHNCQRRCNGQWWLGHAEYKGKLKSIQRLISKSLTENVRKSGDRNKCLYLYFRSLSAFYLLPSVFILLTDLLTFFHKKCKEIKEALDKLLTRIMSQFFLSCIACHPSHSLMFSLLLFYVSPFASNNNTINMIVTCLQISSQT